MQKKPIVDFRKLLQERLDKTNPRRKLAKDETTKLAKLEGIVEKLKRGENVQNLRLTTWLTEDAERTNLFLDVKKTCYPNPVKTNIIISKELYAICM